MKKIFLPILTAISMLFVCFIIFTVSDEIFSKKDLLITGAAALVSGFLGICASGIISPDTKKIDFLYAGIIAFFFVFP